MEKVINFQIEDIDGCEFIEYKDLSKAMISVDRDEYGYPTGKILYVFPDGSYGTKSEEEAQRLLDSGKWVVLR